MRRHGLQRCLTSGSVLASSRASARPVEAIIPSISQVIEQARRVHAYLGMVQYGMGGRRRRTAAAGLYDTELREKTRFWSASPVFRRCAAAALAPLT